MKLALLSVIAIIGDWLDATASRASSPLRWLNAITRNSKHTVAGASQPNEIWRACAATTGLANSFASSPADGRRGVQERS